MAEFLTKQQLMARGQEAATLGVDLALGGAGVAVGMFSAKYIGETVESIVTKEDVTAESTLSAKAIAWMSNNLPKGVLAYMTSMYKSGNDEIDKVIGGITYGLAGSIVVDTYARSVNSGVPTLVLDGKSNNKMLSLERENNALKAAVKRLGQNQPGQYSLPSLRSVQTRSVQPRSVQPQIVQPQVQVIEPETAQPKRKIDEQFGFTDRYTKRPMDESFGFVGGDMVAPAAMGAFGFLGA